MRLTGGSLCSGAGGLDLGLEYALEIDWLWHAEPDETCSRILRERWACVPNYGDIFNVDWEGVERVHLVAAGFPCPDYSLAGRRTGIGGDHGQVWFGVAAALRVLRPAYVVLENVPGILSASGVEVDAGESAVGVVLSDLAALGYDVAWSCLRAADVGAPHGRLRWFCVGSLTSAADDLGAGVGSGGAVRSGDQGTLGSERSAPPAVPAGATALLTEDAVADGGRAAADSDGADGRGWAEAGRIPAAARTGDPPSAGGGEAAADAQDKRDARLAPAQQTGEAGQPEHEDQPSAADADGGRLEGVGQPELGGVERARRGEPDGRDPDGELEYAAQAAADPGGVGRERWPADERGGVRAEDAAVGNEGGDHVGDGGRPRDGAAADACGVGREGRGSGESGRGAIAERGRPAAADADGAGREEQRGPVAVRAELGSVERDGGEDPVGLGAAAADAEGDGVAIVASRDGREPAVVGAADRAGAGASSRRAPARVRVVGRGAGVARAGGSESDAAVADADGAAGGSVGARPGRGEVQGAEEPGWAPLESGRRGGGDQDGSPVARAAAVADPGVESGQSGGGWRAPGGDPAWSGAEERNGEGQLGPSEQGPDAEASAADSERERRRERQDAPAGGNADEAAGESEGGDGSGCVDWGVYGAAVERWARIIGRPAPAPTDERGRLAPEFVEWMLGYPEGWFDVPGLTRTAKLRALGNSVQVQAAERVGLWLVELVTSGLLPAGARV